MKEENGQIKLDSETMEKIKKAHEKEKKKKKKEQPEDEDIVGVGTIIFRVLCAVISVAYFGLLFFGRFVMDKEGWFLSSIDPFSKAQNPNQWLRVAGLIIFTLTVSFILRFFIGRLVNNKKVTKKIGIAFIELLGNLVKYVSYIVLIFLVLGALGVNTAEILAGLGIIGLIIGLGMTSLIEDIVAGIFIIAERTFDVGDIIVLDGFRGTVISIGIRCTKIADIGNDVLTIRNSSIGALVNLTERNSSAAITIPIAPGEDIALVDRLFKGADLDAMSKKYAPMIIDKPLVLGVCSMSPKGVQDYLIVGICKEQFKFDVQRALFYEFKHICDENGIKTGTPGVMIDESEE